MSVQNEADVTDLVLHPVSNVMLHFVAKHQSALNKVVPLRY